MLRGDSAQLLVWRVGGHPAEEPANLEPPAPQIGAQHSHALGRVELLGNEGLDPAAEHQLTATTLPLLILVALLVC